MSHLSTSAAARAISLYLISGTEQGDEEARGAREQDASRTPAGPAHSRDLASGRQLRNQPRAASPAAVHSPRPPQQSQVKNLMVMGLNRARH